MSSEAGSDTPGTSWEGPNRLSRTKAQQVKERARRLGISALAKVVQLWIDTIENPKLHIQYRIRCSENIADRFGLPREEVVATLEEEAPKLVEIRTFEPPPSYAAEPPVTEH